MNCCVKIVFVARPLKNIEIIVRQITSKVLVSEDEMSNVFSPGELIGLLRAERMGRALATTQCKLLILFQGNHSYSIGFFSL